MQQTQPSKMKYIGAWLLASVTSSISAIFGVGYFAIGILQWFATIDGLEHWFGISGFFAFILSGFIAYIPLVGTIAGFKGAMDVWGWSFLEAGALFFGPVIVIFVFSWISSMSSRD